ncbi:MAG: restriction endonuclease [Lachnospiraceae bacterium]|nr:restriction endonuclease [Lachnospiraceae bacterium]
MSVTEIVIAVVAGAVLTVSALLFLRWRKRRPLPMDAMEGHDFEYYCAELLRGIGFSDVQVTSGSRDFGADILAERDGVTYAVQCKRYDHPVGIFAIQEVYAAKDYYDRMVGVVMTNAVFTEPARSMAKKLRILLWDREMLLALEKGSVS